MKWVSFSFGSTSCCKSREVTVTMSSIGTTKSRKCLVYVANSWVGVNVAFAAGLCQTPLLLSGKICF